jgi:hypothetical protein
MIKRNSLLIISALLLIIFASCNNSAGKNNSEAENNSAMPIDLQKKTIELKEKELALKERELAQLIQKDSINKLSKPKSKAKKDDQGEYASDRFYIINIAAVKSEGDARRKAQEIENNGDRSGYLWIPDYPSLSGANYYSVYIGPYYSQSDCEAGVEMYRNKYPGSYGLLVSQDNKRVQINGVGRVTVSSN